MFCSTLRRARKFELSGSEVFTTGVSAASLALLFAMKSLPLHAWLRLPASVPTGIFGSLGPFVTMVLFTAINALFGFGLSWIELRVDRISSNYLTQISLKSNSNFTFFTI